MDGCAHIQINRQMDRQKTQFLNVCMLRSALLARCWLGVQFWIDIFSALKNVSRAVDDSLSKRW